MSGRDSLHIPLISRNRRVFNRAAGRQGPWNVAKTAVAWAITRANDYFSSNSEMPAKFIRKNGGYRKPKRSYRRGGYKKSKQVGIPRGVSTRIIGQETALQNPTAVPAVFFNAYTINKLPRTYQTDLYSHMYNRYKCMSVTIDFEYINMRDDHTVRIWNHVSPYDLGTAATNLSSIALLEAFSDNASVYTDILTGAKGAKNTTHVKRYFNFPKLLSKSYTMYRAEDQLGGITNKSGVPSEPTQKLYFYTWTVCTDDAGALVNQQIKIKQNWKWDVVFREKRVQTALF